MSSLQDRWEPSSGRRTISGFSYDEYEPGCEKLALHLSRVCGGLVVGGCSLVAAGVTLRTRQ